MRQICEHLKNIFDSSELQRDSVIRKFRTTAADGKNSNTHFYNLDTIISVEYLIHTLDEDRLFRRKLFPKKMKGKSW